MAKLKQYFNDFINEDSKIKELTFEKGNKRNAILIALAITCFFILPFAFMIGNLLFLGNYTITKILLVVVFAILFLLPRFIYLDILKHYNKEMKNIKFIPGHIVYGLGALLLSILVIVIV